jgi:hypothetical protein
VGDIELVSWKSNDGNGALSQYGLKIGVDGA